MDILKYVKSKGDFPSLLIGIGAVLAGTGAAAIRGNMELLPASLCCLFAVFCQLWVHYFSAWMEMRRVGFECHQPRIKDSDEENTPLALRVLREAMTSTLTISIMLWLTLMTMADNGWLTILLGLLLGVAIFGAGYVMNCGKHPLHETWVSGVATFIFFGPVPVIGTALVQVQHDATGGLWNYFDIEPAIYTGIAMGCLAFAIYLIFKYIQMRGYAPLAERALISSRKRSALRWGVYVSGLVMLADMVFLYFKLKFGNSILICVPAFIAFAMNAYIAFKMKNADVAELRHLKQLSCLNYFLMGLLIMIIWLVVEYPDDSIRVLF